MPHISRLHWLPIVGLLATLTIAGAGTRHKRGLRAMRAAGDSWAELSTALCGHRDRRQDRRGAARGQRRRAAPSGLADQDHDALSAVRAARSRQAQARHPAAGLRQASIQHPTKLGLKPNQTIKVEDAIKALVTKSANDAAVVIAEAHRRHRRRIRQAHDPESKNAGHDQHDLCQCLGAAGRGADHDGARPGHSGPCHPAPVSRLLPIFRDAELPYRGAPRCATTTTCSET